MINYENQRTTSSRSKKDNYSNNINNKNIYQSNKLYKNNEEKKISNNKKENKILGLDYNEKNSKSVYLQNDNSNKVPISEDRKYRETKERFREGNKNNKEEKNINYNYPIGQSYMNSSYYNKKNDMFNNNISKSVRFTNADTIKKQENKSPKKEKINNQITKESNIINLDIQNQNENKIIKKEKNIIEKDNIKENNIIEKDNIKENNIKEKDNIKENNIKEKDNIKENNTKEKDNKKENNIRENNNNIKENNTNDTENGNLNNVNLKKSIPLDSKTEKIKPTIINNELTKSNYILPSYKQKSIIENKTGLENLGNTCFMNTCLQLLIHCPPFIDKLIEESPQNNLSGEFYKLCKNQTYSNKASYPKEIKNQFAKNHRDYYGNSQHDTQEFCRLFLEDISKELNIVKIKPSYQELDDKGKSKIQINKEYDLLFKKRENSIIVNTFYGQLINIFKCTCGFESYSFEKVLDLPLLFNEREKNQNLNDLLDKYFENDFIEWSSKCENCHKIKEHEKQVKIAYPPEILILSLQRINERTGRKNSSIVDYQEEIDLFKYIDLDCAEDYFKNINQNYSSKYKLISTGNHSGSMEYGHYTANVNILGKWYEFNDERCYSCNFRNSSSNVYVLMFQRVE